QLARARFINGHANHAMDTRRRIELYLHTLVIGPDGFLIDKQTPARGGHNESWSGASATNGRRNGPAFADDPCPDSEDSSCRLDRRQFWVSGNTGRRQNAERVAFACLRREIKEADPVLAGRNDLLDGFALLILDSYHCSPTIQKIAAQING